MIDELPPGAPAALGWFLAWAFSSILLSQLIGLFNDSGGQLEDQARRKSNRALDKLNQLMQGLLRPAVPSEADPFLERPVGSRNALETLYNSVAQAWHPLRLHKRLGWATHRGRVCCGLHLAAAFVLGLSWWATDGNDAVTKVAIAVFTLFLAPIVACVAVQLDSMVRIGMGPDD